MTQVRVAKALGQTQYYLSRCESGKRRVDAVELQEFATLYSTSINVLCLNMCCAGLSMSDKQEYPFEQLRSVLETWPLYRRFRFYGGKTFALPEQISMYCEICRGERNFRQPPFASGGGAIPSGTMVYPVTEKSGFSEIVYTCRNCEKRAVNIYYQFSWKQYSTDCSFVKVGQYPPLENTPREPVAKQLSSGELELYKRALTSRNFGFGIGSLAYLRRIVEDKMNALLDLIGLAIQQDGEVPEEFANLEMVKGSGTFDAKISYAASVLPKHLRPFGKNPIDHLHDLASEGLHHKTEDECLEIFDKARIAFEFVFQRIQVDLDEAKEYIKALKSSK